MKTAVVVSALAAVALAAPHAKRDIHWTTEMLTKTEVVDVTKTVWVNAADATSSSVTSQEDAAAQVLGTADQQDQAQGYDRGDDQTASPNLSTSFVRQAYVPTTASAPSAPTSNPYVAPAPPTSTSPYVAPAPSTTTAAANTAPVAPAPSSAAPSSSYTPPSSGSGSGSGGCDAYSAGATCSGAQYSYYDAGMGACGMTNTDEDYIFAFPSAAFDAVTGANPNNSPLCGKKITMTAYNGTKITATLRDRCPGCSAKQLDLTPALWKAVSFGDPYANGICHGYTWQWQ